MKNSTSRLNKLLLLTLVIASMQYAQAGTDVPTRMKQRANMESIVFGNKYTNKSHMPWSFVLSGALLTTVVLYKTCQKIYPSLSLRKLFGSKKSVNQSSIMEEEDPGYEKRRHDFLMSEAGEEKKRKAAEPKKLNNFKQY